MILTNDEKMASRARYLTTQAKDDEVKYVHSEIGYNYRMTNVAAAIGVAQLEKIDEYINIKRKNFLLYEQGLAGVRGLKLIGEPAYAFANFWFYSLVVDSQKYGQSNFELMDVLAKAKIQSRPLWKLCHQQKPYHKFISYKIEKARKYLKQVINLPCSLSLLPEQICRVVEIIKANAK